MQLPPDNSLSHHMQHKTKNVKVDSKNHTPKNYLFQNFSFNTRSKISAQEHVIGQEGSAFGKSLEHLCLQGTAIGRTRVLLRLIKTLRHRIVLSLIIQVPSSTQKHAKRHRWCWIAGTIVGGSFYLHVASGFHLHHAKYIFHA